MSDSLGPIVIPDPPYISQFPFVGDYTTGADFTPPIAIQVFDQPGLKTEQRYLLGSGSRRFRVYKDHLSCDDYDHLKAHWEQAQGQYAWFPYVHATPEGTQGECIGNPRRCTGNSTLRGYPDRWALLL